MKPVHLSKSVQISSAHRAAPTVAYHAETTSAHRSPRGVHQRSPHGAHQRLPHGANRRTTLTARSPPALSAYRAASTNAYRCSAFITPCPLSLSVAQRLLRNVRHRSLTHSAYRVVSAGSYRLPGDLLQPLPLTARCPQTLTSATHPESCGGQCSPRAVHQRSSIVPPALKCL